MFRKVTSNRWIQMTVLAILGLSLFGLGVLVARPVEPVTAAPEVLPQAPAASWDCIVTESGAFSVRVAVRCNTSPGSGVYFFAVSNADSATASRYLSLFTSALLSGKTLRIFYDPAARGDAYGCWAADCRPFSGAVLLP